MGFASGPLAKRKTAGTGRLRDGMLGMKAMLIDQVLGRLAMLAIVLLVVLALKAGERRIRRVLIGMQRNERVTGGRCDSYGRQACRMIGTVARQPLQRYFT